MSDNTQRLSLESIQNQLTNKILSMLLIVGLLAMVISSIRYIAIGLSYVMIIYVSIWLVSLVTYLNRNKTTQRARAYFIVCLLYSIGTISVLSLGASGSGTVILFTTTIVAALLINNKVSFTVLLLSVFSIALTTFLQHSNYLPTLEVNSPNTLLRVWVMKLISFTLFSLVITLAIKHFSRYLIQANEDLSQEAAKHSARAENSERLLQAVLDALPYRVFWKDKDLNYLGANKAFLNDGGMTSQVQIIGKSDHDMPWKEQAELFRSDDKEVIDSQKPKLNIEEPFTTDEGNTNYLLTNKVPLIDEHQQVFGILGAFDDISAQKELELALRQAKIDADQASIAKTEFLANMSHEIRTPLNGVNGLIELCLSTDLNEIQRDYLNKTQESAKLLHAVLNDILDISKIEAGKLELENINFCLKEHISKLATLLQPLADDKGLELIVIDNVPNDNVYHGDPTRLMQVLLNLSNNAIKFTDKGQVSIKFNVTHTEKSAHLSFDVTDSGIGIAAEQQPKLFQNFNQADSSMSRRFGGTGLGLSIVKKIINLMHGEIVLQSELGKGSTFTVSIPLETQEAITEEKEKIGIELTALSSIKILLVEDNKINQMIARKTLEQYGGEVIVANDGLEALESLSKESFDVVLMDIQMPKMDGCEAIKEIRSQEKYQHLPVIALTANVMSHEVEKYYQKGFNSHVGKPFQKNELIDKIYDLVRNK